MRRTSRLPDATGFLIGQIIALAAGLILIPCSYRYRRRELRLRSRRGAWGWAIVDGLEGWILIAAIVAGIWLATRLSNGSLAFWAVIATVALLAGAFAGRTASRAVAPRIMRWLRA